MAKRRVVKNAHTVSLDDANTDKIYAFRTSNGIYKLQQLAEASPSYWWVNAIHSAGIADYARNSLANALERALNIGWDVWQFDTWQEFVDWSLEKKE
jgi:hypothetical protein